MTELSEARDNLLVAIARALEAPEWINGHIEHPLFRAKRAFISAIKAEKHDQEVQDEDN